MTEIDRPLREAMAAIPTTKKPATASDSPNQEAIVRESAARYRRFAEEVNRSGEKEMERALLKAL